MNTVQENKEKYSKRWVERAEVAKRTYGLVGNLSTSDFKNMAKAGMIQNCPVTTEDIEIANHIYGPYIASLKVKRYKKKNYTSD